ncbi:hypothetical protein AA23498_1428 [Acetobacter nitrogenifigens DSM 23921 = NBRC 105050]|nr:hypothetical protein AA23498_1428 [Acetobacter nitrogenifigens DSM 23921 = NBRC 105050]
MSSADRKINAIMKEFLLIRKKSKPPSRDIVMLIYAREIAADRARPCWARRVTAIRGWAKENLLEMYLAALYADDFLKIGVQT